MLQRAVVHEVLLRDLAVPPGQAQREPQVDLGIGVGVEGAELDDIAQAFGRAVFTAYAVVGFGRRADVAESEVYFAVDLGHGGNEQLLETVEGVGAFGHYVRFQWHFLVICPNCVVTPCSLYGKLWSWAQQHHLTPSIVAEMPYR